MTNLITFYFIQCSTILCIFLIAVVSSNQLQFPSVTVCNTNKLRRSAIRDSIYSDLLVVDTDLVLPYYVPCMNGDFNCSNGIHCIKPYLVCDGIIHCEDKSDENDCFYDECGQDEFRCEHGSERGVCLPLNLVCDKKIACYDGQDEDNCECDVTTDYRCILSSECISNVKTCDGIYDCRDGSDESSHVCDASLTGAEIRVGGNVDVMYNELCGSRLTATQTSAMTFTVVCDTPLYGRFLSIHIKEKTQHLILCEVEIMAVVNKASNVAYGKRAEQSSQYRDGSAIKAVDGDTSSDYSHHSCMHTQLEYEPWWRVDIEYQCEIQNIVITNRQDCCSDRLIGAEVRVGNSKSLNESNILCGTVTRDNIDEVVIFCGDAVGRYVSIQIKDRTDQLHLCEVKVLGKVLVGTLSNVALNKSVYESSVWYGNTADKAVDGDTTPDLYSGTCFHSAEESEPWWRVDLGSIHYVYKVYIYNRQDFGNWRLAGAVVRVGYYEDPKQNFRCDAQVVPQITYWGKIPRTCSVPILGRYVSVQLEGVDSGVLQLCEVQVLGKELLIDPVEKIKQRALFALFDKRQFRRLISDDGEVYTDVSLETCLDKCYFRKAFVCKSFDYSDATHVCTIYSVAADNMKSYLMVDANVNYYQRLLHGDNTSNCPSGMWQCGSGECLHPYRVCDIIKDCLDASDEADCMFRENKTEGLEHERLSFWLDIFKDITPDLSVYHHFLEYIYHDSRFYRVKGENPPDWTRFKTFSKTPDHSDLRQVLKLTEEEVSRYGHQKKTFILQCTFASEQCGPSDLTQFQDSFYGNCFQFNVGSDEQIKWAMGTGPQYGLQLTLFTEQEEYLSIYGQDSGARVSILPRDIFSFPVDEGITVKPGTITSIAIKESCEKACSENALIHYCGCAEYLFTEAPRCQLLNKTQDLCRQLTKYLNNIGEIKCNCPSPCKETNYDITSSQSQWPSDVYLNKLLKTLKWKHSNLKNVNDMQSARSNLVRLEIYFETLNYDSVSEQAAYKWEDLLSDIGGTLGLYVGISIISVFEFVKFILMLCRQCPKRNRNNVGQWVRRRQSRVGEQPVIT
ncbi:uncharacterized protein LOC144359476 [Saccoglossus kowalevskii]